MPHCVYCGGPNETVDHIPPIAMFDGRDRPPGLEFPCCRACNGGSKDTDAVIALLSRIYPDAATDPAMADLRKYGASVSRNMPDILLEMRASRNQERRALSDARVAAVAAGVMNVGGPLVSAHLVKFGAKFGLAMHSIATGNHVPPEGGVTSAIFSNMDVVKGSFPAQIVACFGTPQTLEQGIKRVGEQFQYNVVKIEGSNASAAFAMLRASFFFFTFSAEDVTKLSIAERAGARLFRPGAMKQPIVAEFPRLKCVFANPSVRWL
jgi:hypothetical protein